MKVIIFGGSGFIGKHLLTYFTAKGVETVVVSRYKKQAQQALITNVTWDEIEKNTDIIENADAFINLAGETINQYWTPKAKEKILESRIGTTKKVAALVLNLKKPPKVVINSSAVGVYGMSQTTVFDEFSPPSNEDFLARVVTEWENSADMIEPYARVVKIRLGVVLGGDGGAFPKMMLPYKYFIGGKIGSGKQWLSWIHIDDLIRLIEFCIINENIKGPINATAPTPVTNEEFGMTIANVLNRPHYLSVPAFVLRVMLGEMSQLLLNGQKVLPKRAVEFGFSFTYPTIAAATHDLLQ